ncbi:MAG: hypothetical protein ACPLZ9_02760 [Candidatus Ratteibacteria bacterium]|jgi:hypothetical protein
METTKSKNTIEDIFSTKDFKRVIEKIEKEIKTQRTCERIEIWLYTEKINIRIVFPIEKDEKTYIIKEGKWFGFRNDEKIQEGIAKDLNEIVKNPSKIKEIWVKDLSMQEVLLHLGPDKIRSLIY